MKTNTNLLTEAQMEAVKESIMDSMRKSLSKTNLKYDPTFDQMIDFISNNIIKNAQDILEKDKATKKERKGDYFHIKLLKSDPVLRKIKKEDFHRIMKSDKELEKYIKNNPIKNARK